MSLQDAGSHSSSASTRQEPCPQGWAASHRRLLLSYRQKAEVGGSGPAELLQNRGIDELEHPLLGA